MQVPGKDEVLVAWWQDARSAASCAREQVGAWPLLATGGAEIVCTPDLSITIRNMDITMTTISSQECASAHLIKLK